MPKRRIAKGNARSLAQKRAQQKAAEASARARRKLGGDEPSARRAVARLDTNSPNNKRDVVALKEAVKGSTARGKLSLAASAKVGRENVINDADRIAYRASAAESRRLKVKLGENAPTADKIFSTAKKIAKIRAGGDEVKTADIKKASLSLDPDEKTPEVAKKIPLKERSIVVPEKKETIEQSARKILDAKGGTLGAVADGLAKMGLGKSEQAKAVRKLTDSQIVRSGSLYKDLDDATIKQAISNLVDKRDRTSGEEDRLKGLRAEQRRRSVNRSLGRSVNPDHRRVSKASDEKTIAGLSKWSVQDLRNRLESKNTSDQLKKAISAELDSRSKAEGGGSPRTKPAATPKSMTDARLRDEIKKAKPNSPELYDLQEELGDRDSASPQERRNAKAAMQAKSDLKRESRQSDPDLISSRGGESLPEANDAAGWANLIGSKQRREIAAMTPRQRENFKKQLETSNNSGRVSDNVKASNQRSIDYIDALNGNKSGSQPGTSSAPNPARSTSVTKKDPTTGIVNTSTTLNPTEYGADRSTAQLMNEQMQMQKALENPRSKEANPRGMRKADIQERLSEIRAALKKRQQPAKKAAPSASRSGVNEQIYQQEAKRELQKVESNRVRSVISSLGGSTASIHPMDDESDYTYTSDGKVQHKEGGFVVVLNDKPDLVSLRAKLENNGFEVSIDEPNSAHPKIVIVPKDDEEKKPGK